MDLRLLDNSFKIRDLNWLLKEIPQTPVQAEIKVRYAQQPIEAIITPTEDGSAIVTLPTAERAITPGQACVAYDGDRLIGGGWIARS